MNYFFPYEVGVCAYIGEYQPLQVKRWLAWLGRRGTSCVYLYTSVDMPELSQEVMEEILTGRVVIINIGVPEGKSVLEAAYNDCMGRVRYVCKYLALLQPGDYLEGAESLRFDEIARMVFSPDVGVVEFSCSDGGVRHFVDPMLMREISDGSIKGIPRCHLRKAFGVNIGRKKRKHIALISHVMARNGAPLAILSTAKILKKFGYEIDVYSVAKGPLEREFEKLGIAVIVDPYIHSSDLVDQPWYYAYDLFLVNTAVMLKCFQKPLREVPAIWWLHESSSSLKWCGVNEELLSGVSGENVHIMAVSQVAKRAFEALAPNLKAEGILTLGVEDAFRGRKRVRRENEPFVFMMCGTLEKRKGQDIFLKAIGLMKEGNRKKCRFYLLGEKGQSTEPGYEDEVRSLAAKYPEVKLISSQPHEKILEMYGKVDAVVVPSREETLSIVAVEAMMMGVPCIVSDSLGVVPYIINEKSAMVFDDGKSEALVMNLDYIVENNEKCKYIGINGRKVYESVFKENIFAKNVLELVDKLIRRR